MVLLERYEPPDRLDPKPSIGYHLGYHECQTRKVMEGSDGTPGCIRIIKYRFGGLSMMVKYDVAAYKPSGDEDDLRESLNNGSDGDVEMRSVNGTEPIDIDIDTRTDAATDITSKGGRPTQSTASVINHDSLDGLSSLAEEMEGLDFDDPVYNGQSIAITYFPHHRPPSQESLVSIKTKIHHHERDLTYYFPQHFFAQVPTLHYARHQMGDFSRFALDTYDMLDERMMQENQEGIDRMAALLRWIVGIVKEHGAEGTMGEGDGLGLVWDGKRFSVAIRQGGPQLSAPVVEMIMDARKEQGQESGWR